MNKKNNTRNKKSFYFTCFVAVLCLCSFATVVRATDPEIVRLSQKKLPVLQEPPFNIVTLKNGIKLYYLQDSELPIFKMVSYFETGALYETKDQRGLNDLMFSLLRSGGTEKMTSHQIDDDLDFLSAKISADGGSDLSSVSLVCLEKDIHHLLDIYFDILKKPVFEQERLDVIKTNVLNAIKRRNEDPMNIGQREFLQSLYGENSVYAWTSTSDTISKIDRNTLIQYYKNNIAPNHMLIAASSPLDFKEFLKVLEPYTSDWTSSLPAKQRPAEIKKEWQKTTEFIQKEGNQSAIVMGHFGDRRFNKDKYKILLVDEMLGASTFGSRLGNHIRTDLGLVYSIRSSFGFERDYAPFRVMTQTKSESTVQTINEIQKILSDMVENKNFTEKELDLAKERIINRLVFQYDEPFNMVTTRLTYDYYGYPPDYLNFYRKQIEAVTLADINGVLAQYFFPDKLKMMIVGDKTKIKDLNLLDGLKERPLDNE